MAEAAFHPPRRKRRVFESYEAPFPVDAGGKDFRLCQAEIINNNVIVRDPEDIEQLYNKGYFGKGILSRSRPVFSISDPLLVAKWRGVDTNMPIITSQKYQRRVQWAKSVLQEQGLDEGSVTQILENYTKPCSRGDGAGQSAGSRPRDPENPALSRGSSGNEGFQSLEGQNGGSKEEGEAAEDPGSSSGDQERGNSGEIPCHREPPALRGCEEEPREGMDCRECAPEYVSLEEEEEEEEEGSSCPEDGSTHTQGNLVKKEALVCRKNPFRIFEYLQLSLEE
ncbi:SEN2 endonuclease, partial [Pomatostomus ruficeps]|nr:SEN2 endonuclease [Pomatostomus ruficeps]